MPNLTAEQLRKIVSYNAETGVMVWIANHTRRSIIGDEVGFITAQGYRNVGMKGRLYVVHRLAWLYAYGDWPIGTVDHINGERADNRLCNLRLATGSQQNANSRVNRDTASGLRGVWLSKTTGRWRANIKINGRFRCLGTFDDKHAAAGAYRLAAEKHFGEYAYHLRPFSRSAR